MYRSYVLIAGLLDPKRIFLWTVASLLTALLTLLGAGCQSGSAPLTAEVPLHLEEHLEAATIEGSEVPADVPSVVEWRFDEPQPGWKPAPPRDPSAQRVQVSRTDDALRMMLREPPPQQLDRTCPGRNLHRPAGLEPRGLGLRRRASTCLRRRRNTRDRFQPA